MINKEFLVSIAKFLVPATVIGGIIGSKKNRTVAGGVTGLVIGGVLVAAYVPFGMAMTFGSLGLKENKVRDNIITGIALSLAPFITFMIVRRFKDKKINRKIIRQKSIKK
jgi:mannose/fructose/N-acetylgalactosamine-specific phosphotransferase system component IID